MLVMLACTALGAHAGLWWDDFEAADLRQWEIYNLDRAVEGWDAIDGTAIGEIFTRGFFSLLLLKPANKDARDWSSYTAQVRVRLLRDDDDGETRAGLSLYDHEFEGMRYLFQLAFNTNEAHIVRASDDFWQVIVFPMPLEEGVWYDLTASVQSEDDVDLLTFQIDDGPEFAARAAGSFGSGLAGLVVSDGRAAFDDFQVRGGSVPNGGRGAPRTVTSVGQLGVTWAQLKSGL